MILLLVVTIVITGIALYFLERLDDEHPRVDFLTLVLIFGICAIPSLLIMVAFDYFTVSKDHYIIPTVLPILTFGFLAVWATWGNPKSSKNTADKKDNFTAEAIILTTVLSENDSSDDSDSSNSSDSSHSSSSSSPDDFYIL